jgi:hypothetical protein
MLDSQQVTKFRKLSHVGLGAIFVTAISGNDSLFIVKVRLLLV